MNVLIITHSDGLDGQFCIKLLELAYAELLNIKITQLTADYTNLQQQISEIYVNREQYDRIYITDLSIEKTEPSYHYIKAMLNEQVGGRRVFVVDHHKHTLDALSDIDVSDSNKVIVQLSDKGTSYRTSASLLLYRFLCNFPETRVNMSYCNKEVLDVLVSAISDWDTWMWVDNDNTFAKELQKLYCSRPLEESVNMLTSYCIDLSLTVEKVKRLCSSQIYGYKKCKNKFMEYIKEAAQVVEHKDFRALFFILPAGIRQECKGLFVEELLRENNVFNVDYFILGDKDNFRVYCNTKDLNTFLKPAGLGSNNSGHTYCAISSKRVARCLGCNYNKPWSYYFSMIIENIDKDNRSIN